MSTGGPYTKDPTMSKLVRVLRVLGNRANRDRSNRELARLAQVDERTVRRYRDRLGLPKLEPHTGRPKSNRGSR